MGTQKTNNYEDFIKFTRSSGATSLRPVTYGIELVQNGSFDSDTSGWTTNGATLVLDNSDPYEGSYSALVTSTEGTGRIVQTITTKVGSIYQLSAFVKYNSGDTGSVEVLGIEENNSKTQVLSSYTEWRLVTYSFVATETQTQLRIRERGPNNNSSFYIDNISVKEVLFDRPDGTLTVFEHPSNVPRIDYTNNNDKVRYRNISSQILSANAGTEPQATEFNVSVNGRKVGDVSNNGTVSAFDSSLYLTWLHGDLSDQSQVDYIENVMNPYIEENLSKYLYPLIEGIQSEGLLIEQPSTNLHLYSDLNFGWDDSASDSRVFNADIGPDGLKSATEFNLSLGGYLYDAVPVVAGTVYTASWYMKAGTATGYVYAFYDETNGEFISRIEYDIVNGTSADRRFPEYVGNGWYRHSYNVIAPSGCTSIRVYPLREQTQFGAVPGARGTTLLWGAQFEASPFQTSFIRTLNATATRAADSATIKTSDFGYNINEGTVLCDFKVRYNENGTGFPRPWEIGNANTTQERINLYVSEASGNLSSAMNTDNVNQGTLTLETATPLDVVSGKVAISWKKDSLSGSDNGDSSVEDTSVNVQPVGFVRDLLKIGGNTANLNTNMFGHVKSIKYYPRRLTHAQLESLSS